MNSKSNKLRVEAGNALRELSTLQAMLPNPVRFDHLVTNFEDPDGSISTAWMKAAEAVGEFGLSIGSPGEQGIHKPHMRGLWIDRWPVDLKAFWDAVGLEMADDYRFSSK